MIALQLRVQEHPRLKLEIEVLVREDWTPAEMQLVEALQAFIRSRIHKAADESGMKIREGYRSEAEGDNLKETTSWEGGA